MSISSKIKEAMREKNAVPPFTVWSAGFMDMRDGVPIPNSGIPNPQKGTASTQENAIELYTGHIGSIGSDVHIVTVPRIEDANGTQIYPQDL